MQAIETKYLCPTNTRGARIKATCARGSITVDYDHSTSHEGPHVKAADALVAKFVREDEKRYGTTENPWSMPRAVGQLQNGNYVHVYAA